MSSSQTHWAATPGVLSGQAPPPADMRFAYYISPRARGPEQHGPLLDVCTEMTLEAEAAGFDAVFLTEHHLSTHNPFQNSLQYGAYLAPQLTRMYVGLSTVIPTLHQPVRLVEQCNLLDQLTRGRLVVGMGPGSMPHEFDAFGRDVAQRDELYNQTMELLRRLWHVQPGDEPIAFATLAERGFIDRPINPPPYRKPTPILARATFTGGVMEDMGRLGWPLFVGPWSPAEVQERLAPYWSTLLRSGHSEQVLAECRRWTGMMKWIHVAESDAQAKEDIHGVVERLNAEMATHGHAPRLPKSQEAAVPEVSRDQRVAGRPFDSRRMVEMLALAGSPDTVAAKLQAYAEAGIGIMMGMFLRDFEEIDNARRSFRLFVDQVLPRFQTVARPVYAPRVADVRATPAHAGGRSSQEP